MTGESTKAHHISRLLFCFLFTIAVQYYPGFVRPVCPRLAVSTGPGLKSYCLLRSTLTPTSITPGRGSTRMACSSFMV